MTTKQRPNHYETDFELAVRVTRAVEQHYGHQRIMNWESDVPIGCRIVEFTCSNVGYAECEGYVQLLGLKCQHRELASCFQQLGLPDLALVVDQMLDPIPVERVLGNLEALERHFGGWDEYALWVSPFEDKLFEAHDRIVCAVASYCRAHSSNYSHLGPDIGKLLHESNV